MNTIGLSQDAHATHSLPVDNITTHTYTHTHTKKNAYMHSLIWNTGTPTNTHTRNDRVDPIYHRESP